jgi:hypothetical protein
MVPMDILDCREWTRSTGMPPLSCINWVEAMDEMEALPEEGGAGKGETAGCWLLDLRLNIGMMERNDDVVPVGWNGREAVNEGR